MKAFLFSFLVLLFYCEIHSQRHPVNNHEFKKYYEKYNAKAILFESLNYDEDCFYREDTAIFTGYAIRKYKNAEFVMCHIKNGKNDTVIYFDSIKRIKEVRIINRNRTEDCFVFYSSGNLKYHYLHGISENCDSVFNHQLKDIFGPSPEYLQIFEYYESGRLKKEIYFDSLFRQNGIAKLYHKNGNIFIKAEFRENKPVGKWKQYNSSGICVGYIKWGEKKVIKAKWFEYDSAQMDFVKMSVKNGKRNEKVSKRKLKIPNEEVIFN